MTEDSNIEKGFQRLSPKVGKQAMFMRDVAYLIFYALSIGVYVTGGELSRTREQQQIHFDAGRSKTMKSKHLERLAIDLNFFIDGKLTYDKSHPLLIKLGEYWEKLRPGNRWGGNFVSFTDTPHFEAN